MVGLKINKMTRMKMRKKKAQDKTMVMEHNEQEKTFEFFSINLIVYTRHTHSNF